MSLLGTLFGWFGFVVSSPAVLIILVSIIVATCTIIGIVLASDRKLSHKIREVTDSKFFTIALKTFYIGYDPSNDTLSVALLATKNRKRVDISVLKFFSKTSSYGKDFVISALRIQLSDSVIQFADASELEDIISDAGKWCDRIVRVEIRPSELPKELDKRDSGLHQLQQQQQTRQY